MAQAINSKRWREKHPKRWKEIQQKYREKLRKQGIGIKDVSFYGRPKKELLKFWNYRCAICGFKNKLCVHHIDKKGINVSAIERNNNLENLVILCAKCHFWIHTPERQKKLKLSERKLWSSKGIEKCLICGTIERKHYQKGLCLRCFEKTRKEYKANYYRKHYRVLTT